MACEVNSDLVPFTRWEKDRQPLELNSRLLQLPSGALVVSNASEADAGLYRCLVDNVGSSSKSSDEAQLHVLPGERPVRLLYLWVLGLRLGSEPRCTSNRRGLNSTVTRTAGGFFTCRVVEQQDAGSNTEDMRLWSHVVTWSGSCDLIEEVVDHIPSRPANTVWSLSPLTTSCSSHLSCGSKVQTQAQAQHIKWFN